MSSNWGDPPRHSGQGWLILAILVWLAGWLYWASCVPDCTTQLQTRVEWDACQG